MSDIVYLYSSIVADERCKCVGRSSSNGTGNFKLNINASTVAQSQFNLHAAL